MAGYEVPECTTEVNYHKRSQKPFKGCTSCTSTNKVNPHGDRKNIAKDVVLLPIEETKAEDTTPQAGLNIGPNIMASTFPSCLTKIWDKYRRKWLKPPASAPYPYYQWYLKS